MFARIFVSSLIELLSREIGLKSLLTFAGLSTFGIRVIKWAIYTLQAEIMIVEGRT
jgi:hypothetical protein